MASHEWIEHAYPLQQITVQVQGTRHSDRKALIDQLETVIAKLLAGYQGGSEHDDDFGYRFKFEASASGPSFFDDPAGMDMLSDEPAGLAGEVQAVLMEKIKQLDSELKRVTAIACEAQRCMLGNVLRPLRARETVLLYFGAQSAKEYAATIQENFSDETARHIMRDAFFLNGSPLDPEQQQALRLALHERWFPK